MASAVASKRVVPLVRALGKLLAAPSAPLAGSALRFAGGLRGYNTGAPLRPSPVAFAGGLRGYSTGAPLRPSLFSDVFRDPFGAPQNLVKRMFASAAPRGGQPRFRKQFRGRMKGEASQGNRISFGTYALQALGSKPAWVTARQIEAGRRAIARYAGRGGKIWVRAIADKPVTERPAEVRMGRGKGSVAYKVAVVKPGRILYELSGVSEAVAREAISMAGSKMSMRSRFLRLEMRR